MKREIPKPSITAVVEHYGSQVVGRGGGWQKATCPLNSHEDMSPSASLNEDECRWRCFSCDKGGDAIDLIMENEGVDFRKASELATTYLTGMESDNRSEVSSSLHVGGGKRRSGGNWTPPWAGL